VSNFTNVILKDNIDLSIIQSSDRKIVVSYGENIINGVQSKVEGNTLLLYNSNRCNWLRSYSKKPKVIIYEPELTHLRFEGAGSVNSIDTLRYNSFSIDSWGGTGTINLTLISSLNTISIHTGAADIKINGLGGVTYVYGLANGYIDCENFNSGFTFVNNSGSGDFRVQCQKELSVYTGYIGDVYYKGSPYKVEHTKTGSGNLIKID